ncbi:hypothetical protein A3J19_03005 [Candidatus Daviesbacteria bacterium RIFCSPLOWO2_02_FULL_41_8]|uniref:Uncharacterized protein n=2 Tax=Candidatus Daviesiibacteriota TaxID=1752718 RepID=A0A1F5NMI1_9BACT|nr:MAG: hypothetical protein A2871_03865 [Candidatus Daviesbacteria bacterium RIFCSPHIGHO2_01_FULL_41_23]OGE62321.1 MAG: hypothetical protein A2967_02605 [Candidatus Daviesbacteria bacterium RIFCSPLOWO2_01_FULL_41_32]OGE78734.1 MAG: hypothetical protein A3J19_03005 [Candidatus Daviesbacteria bacterium RIFCSPLOWO2_02_FULL_41_8]
MSEKGSGSVYWSKAKVIRYVRETEIRWTKKQLPKSDPRPNSGLNHTNQNQQVKATLQEAEEVLHQKRPAT